MKQYVVFLIPTGYRANGEKLPPLFAESWQLLISASTKKVAEKRGRKILDEDWEWTHKYPNNPAEVAVCAEEMTIKKARAICARYEHEDILLNDWQCQLLEHAQEFLYEKGVDCWRRIHAID